MKLIVAVLAEPGGEEALNHLLAGGHDATALPALFGGDRRRAHTLIVAVEEARVEELLAVMRRFGGDGGALWVVPLDDARRL